MFCLEHDETLNVCQRNVAHFGHVECRFEKIHDIFRVLEAWCHCDFRKMEALKVYKFGRTYRTGRQATQAIVVRSYCYFNLNPNVQLGRRDIQLHPAITKCHGTEKNVRYSGIFVVAKTPL